MGVKIKGKPWIGRANMKSVDRMIEVMCPTAFKADPVGPDYSPEDVVQLIKDRAGTQVLATVYLTSWRESWALGVVALILTSCQEHSMLKFLAVKGGPGCDGEIEFLE